jgi:RecB family exonuclease
MSGRIESIQINTRSELPDELRMLYKAVGAASERLIVSATQSEEQQVSQFVTLLLGQVPPATAFNGSRLSLRSIAGGLRRSLALAIQSNRAGEATESAYLLSRLSVSGVPGANPNSWYGARSLSTVEPLVNIESGEELVSISPSKLENFNKCPLHWFLNSHGASESTFAANLGTLMHSAIENFLAESDSAANEAKLWSLVESKWHTLTFEAEWLEQAAKRKAKQMTSNLVQYLRQFEADGSTVIGSELSFSFNEGQANIRGQIDRVELHPDGRVVVIDLKTGKHQYTSKEADAHAQLAMYQLAFEAGALDEAIAAAMSRLGLSTEVSQLQPGGAKLVLVGGDKLVEREQSPLTGSPIREQFIAQIAAATKGMADQVFVAQVDSHCQADNQYGSCSLHLIEAVSYVG